MNNSIVQPSPLSNEQIRSLDTATLRSHLAQALTITAKTLAYLATIWKELEHRGEDLSDLRSGLAQYLPAIADGSLDAEIVVKYAGKKMLLNALSKLSLEEQREVLKTGTLPVVKIDAAGAITKAQVPPNDLNATDIRYVFDGAQIRSESEQAALRRKAVKLQQRPVPLPTARKVIADPSRKTLVVGNVEVSADRVLTALREIYDVDVERLVKQELERRKVMGKLR